MAPSSSRRISTSLGVHIAATCSICRRTRFWPAVAKPEGFHLLSGETEPTQYLFDTRKNQYYFCKHCGVRAFGVGTETLIGNMYAPIWGGLEGVSEEELSGVPIIYVDGQHDRFAPPEYLSHLRAESSATRRGLTLKTDGRS